MIERDASLNYDFTLQSNITDEYIKTYLCRDTAITPGSDNGGMLQRMACLNEEDSKTQYTLDMDAIVASYFWMPQLFTFDKQSLVAFDSVSGMMYTNCKLVRANACLCPGSASALACFEVKRATNFDAVLWFEEMHKLLQFPAA